MKRFWIVLIAALMVAGFAFSASAADVKFSGSYYAQGFYADNWNLKDDASSAALYGQRLRMGMEFKVAEGLTLNTRFDALEGRWGQLGTYGASSYDRSGNDEKNISFDRAWVTFAVPFGAFDVGRMNTSSWGTIFGNNDYEAERIQYRGKWGPVEFALYTEKVDENYGEAGYANVTDGDYDNYNVYGRYRWKGGVAGVKLQYTRDASHVVDATPYKEKKWTIQPYAQATFGQVFVEAEVNYVTGKREYDSPTVADKDYKNAFNAYVHARGDVGPAYVGALYAFVSGDEDPGDDEINKGPSGGVQWDPCLILWNQYSNKWLGNLGGAYTVTTGVAMENAHAFQLYGGFKPVPKLDLKAALTYAKADEKYYGTSRVVDDEIGTELDLTAAYKIYDNLSYTVGFGYLWAGDYYKGTNNNNKIDDTYLLMHRLDLVF